MNFEILGTLRKERISSWFFRKETFFMEYKQEHYEPVINFRKQRPQMQINHVEHDTLYEKAFLSSDDPGKSEYTQNTTTWD